MYRRGAAGVSGGRAGDFGANHLRVSTAIAPIVCFTLEIYCRIEKYVAKVISGLKFPFALPIPTVFMEKMMNSGLKSTLEMLTSAWIRVGKTDI